MIGQIRNKMKSAALKNTSDVRSQIFIQAVQLRFSRLHCPLGRLEYFK